MSSTESIGAISVSLSADLAPYAQALSRGTTVTSDFTRNVDRRIGALDGTFRKAAASARGLVSGLATGFVGGLAAGAVGQLTSTIQGAIKSVAELKAQAQQAGTSVEGFQRLNAAALQARVGTDALVDGLKEMQLRIDEFVTTGGGSAADSLKRIGYDAATLRAGLADVPSLFLDIIGRIQQLDRAARIRVLDELFGGTAGEQFIRLADMGADKVRRIGDEAQASGAIIETELVDRAALLAAQWDLIATVIKTNVVSAILQASAAMGPLIAQGDALGNSLSRLFANPSWLNFNAFMVGGMVEQEAQRVERRTAPPTAADDAREMQRARTFQARTAAPAVTEDRANRARASDAPPIPQTNLPPVPYRPPNLLDYDPNGGAAVGGGGGGGGAAARSAGAEAIRLERDAVAELISSLEEELALVGKSDAEREVSNNLRRAGAEATEAEKATIVELTKALATQEEAQRAANETASAFRGIASDALKGFASDIREGVGAAEALENVFGRIADRLIEMAADGLVEKALGGSNGIDVAGILGRVVGGGLGAPAAGGVYAAGGHVNGPGSGTSDSIPAWLSNGEFVVNARATRRFLPLLSAINDGRLGASALTPISHAPAFAGGGLVDKAIRGDGQDAGSSGAAGGRGTEVHIHNYNGSKVTERKSKTADGRERLDIVLDAQVAEKLKTPGSRSNSVLKGNMGIRQGLRKS